jgi:hypothetical protein
MGRANGHFCFCFFFFFVGASRLNFYIYLLFFNFLGIILIQIFVVVVSDIFSKMSNIENLSLVRLLPHTSHETLPLTRTWRSPWERGRD